MRIEKDIEKLRQAGITMKPGRKPWMPARIKFEKWVNWKIRLIFRVINFLHTLWKLPTYFCRMIGYGVFSKK